MFCCDNHTGVKCSVLLHRGLFILDNNYSFLPCLLCSVNNIIPLCFLVLIGDCVQQMKDHALGCTWFVNMHNYYECCTMYRSHTKQKSFIEIEI